MKSIHLKTKYIDEPALMTFGRYANGRLTIEFHSEHGEPLSRATVNMPGVRLGPNEVVIKDYGENKGTLRCLIDSGLVEDTGKRIKQDYVEMVIVKLTPATLEHVSC